MSATATPGILDVTPCKNNSLLPCKCPEKTRKKLQHLKHTVFNAFPTDVGQHLLSTHHHRYCQQHLKRSCCLMHLTIHSPSATTKDITDFFKKTQNPATVKLCIPSELQNSGKNFCSQPRQANVP